VCHGVFYFDIARSRGDGGLRTRARVRTCSQGDLEGLCHMYVCIFMYIDMYILMKDTCSS